MGGIRVRSIRESAKEHPVKTPLVMTIAVIAIATSSCGLLVAPAPLAVVKDFYDAVSLPHGEDEQAGDQTLEPSDVEPGIDVDGAFATFHPDLQEQLNPEEFENRLTEHALIVSETNRNWITSVENDAATVEGRFTIEGDVEVGSGLFWLSKENDTWKIVAFRIEDESGSFVGGTIPGSEE